MSLGAGAPRSGDATPGECGQTPTARSMHRVVREEAAQMSLGAGAPALAGDATRAKAAGRRQCGLGTAFLTWRRRA